MQKHISFVFETKYHESSGTFTGQKSEDSCLSLTGFKDDKEVMRVHRSGRIAPSMYLEVSKNNDGMLYIPFLTRYLHMVDG